VLPAGNLWHWHEGVQPLKEHGTESVSKQEEFWLIGQHSSVCSRKVESVCNLVVFYLREKVHARHTALSPRLIGGTPPNMWSSIHWLSLPSRAIIKSCWSSLGRASCLNIPVLHLQARHDCKQHSIGHLFSLYLATRFEVLGCAYPGTSQGPTSESSDTLVWSPRLVRPLLEIRTCLSRHGQASHERKQHWIGPPFVDSRQASLPESCGMLVQARHKASYERKQREEREQAKQQPSVSNDAQSRERRPSNNAPPRPAAKAAAPTQTADFFSAPPRRPSRTAEVGRSGTRGCKRNVDETWVAFCSCVVLDCKHG
jgi:hypothetical protein